MTLIYLLWTYQEHGPEDLVATLDKSLIPELVASFPGPNKWRIGPEQVAAILAEKGETPGVYGLSEGWGGLTLQIVEAK